VTVLIGECAFQGWGETSNWVAKRCRLVKVVNVETELSGILNWDVDASICSPRLGPRDASG